MSKVPSQECITYDIDSVYLKKNTTRIMICYYIVFVFKC